MEKLSASIKTLSEALTRYLSAPHRDDPGNGLLHGGARCRGAATTHRRTASVHGDCQKSFEIFHRADAGAGRKQQREDEALATIATIVGAMILARAVDDPELSDRILSVSRKRLLADK